MVILYKDSFLNKLVEDLPILTILLEFQHSFRIFHRSQYLLFLIGDDCLSFS